MNTAKKLLTELAALGITLKLSGKKITYAGPSEVITDYLLDRLREHRPELLALLEADAARSQQRIVSGLATRRLSDIKPTKKPASKSALNSATHKSKPQQRGRTGKRELTAARGLIGEVAIHGGRMVREGKSLRVQAPSPLPGDLQDRLRALKAELLLLLPDDMGSAIEAPPVTLPPDMSAMFDRVAGVYGWDAHDRERFVRWATQNIREARQLLQTESARLATQGRVGRCSAVMGQLVTDPSLNVAWTISDDGDTDPWVAIAVRDHGTVEMSIPRAKYDRLAMPKLIDRLVAAAREAAP